MSTEFSLRIDLVSDYPEQLYEYEVSFLNDRGVRHTDGSSFCTSIEYCYESAIRFYNFIMDEEIDEETTYDDEDNYYSTCDDGNFD